MTVHGPGSGPTPAAAEEEKKAKNFAGVLPAADPPAGSRTADLLVGRDVRAGKAYTCFFIFDYTFLHN